ncbi:hypothetical protein EDB89DRAFT_1981012 [Lactarius sanguifluus]|nr:hypothetical protein EDB89DRAFT_1981012 [Lactarius sanguifluus]
MFTCTIAVDGFGEVSTHYVHQRSAAKVAVPLLFVHGCTSPLPIHCQVIHGAPGQGASSKRRRYCRF